MERAGSGLKHLRVNQLGLKHAISQATALNAPGGTIVLYITSIAALMTFTFSSYPNGAFAIPIILVLSLAIYALMSFSMYEFSKEISSSGGYYSFVSRGLGSGAGYITALSYVSYQFLSFTGFGILGFIGFIYGVFPQLGIHLPYQSFLWIPITVAFVTLISVLIYSGIKPSLKFVSFTIAIELSFFLITSIFLLFKFHNSLTIAPFTPSPVGNNPLILSTMMIYSIGTFVGIGGSIPIAEETKNPKRNVPLAIVSTIIILGVVIVISSYAQVIAWGFSNMSTFGNSANPYPVLSIYHANFGIFSVGIYALLIILVINSYFTATVSLGTNATRVLFSLAREKVINERISRTHPKHGSPTFATLLVAVISTLVVIATGLAFELANPGDPVQALIYASLFLLILESPISYLVHILTNSSLYIYLKKEGKKISLLKHVIIPTVSSITLIFAIFIAIDFDLSAPYVYAIYGSMVWIGVIILATVVMKTKFKQKLDLIGDFSL